MQDLDLKVFLCSKGGVIGTSEETQKVQIHVILTSENIETRRHHLKISGLDNSREERRFSLTEKKNPILLVTDKTTGEKALNMLQKVGIVPDVVTAKPEVGTATVELFSQEGNFDGLGRISRFIEMVTRPIKT